MKLHALTVWSPWSTMIIEGMKRYEFRGRAMPRRFIGQRVVIHAGARPVHRQELLDLKYRLLAGETALKVEPALELVEKLLDCTITLPLAAGLGTVIFEESVPSRELFKDVYDSDRIDHSLWAWPTRDVERWEPVVPARGFQGFWPWTGDIGTALRK